MNVPFVDLKAQYAAIREEIDPAIRQVIDATAFSGGPFVERFEEEFARFCGTRFAIGVGNGTDALGLILRALEIGEGDEVATVPNSFIATAEAVSACGAQPVFVDVDRETFTMDPRRLEAAITPRTRALLPVHLFGQTADMDPIRELAEAHRIPVIEDACQAHGAEYRGKRAGSLGRAAAFSFYPGKNLGAYGEGGAVTTDDGELAARIRMLRDHGQESKYHHRLIGWNARLDGIQAAILSVKLRHLADWNERRRANAGRYTLRLRGLAGLSLPREAAYGRHVYHIYAVGVPERDAVLARMKDRGIACGIHYPIPIHRQKAYESLGLGAGSFPVSERAAAGLLSLPMYAELTEEQIDAVAGALEATLGQEALSARG
jgi:dTDP-4-amino-4,6-dideoxygalactose transaminase